jgi:hypothetical protein
VKVIDEAQNISSSEDFDVYDVKDRHYNDNIMFRQFIENFDYRKKFAFQNPYYVENPSLTAVRYVAFNSNLMS